MSTDIKTGVEDLNKAFVAFKDANDKRLAEIEKNGSASAETEQKVDKLNAQISALQDSVDNMRLEQNRNGLLKEAGEAAKEDLKAFAALAGKSVDDVSVDEMQAYNKAFRAYLRRNNAGSGVDEVKALSVGSDPDGGYTVLPSMATMIQKLVYETSPMRQVANVVTIGTDALEGLNDLYEASSGWVGETEERNETTAPKIGEYRIPVYEQYAEPRATQKLLDDSIWNVEEWLSAKISERLARMENESFINGNGVKKPRGFLTYAAGVPAAGEWNKIERIVSGGSGSFAAEDPGDALINLVYSLKAAYRQNAVFMMRRATLAEVRKLKDGNDNYLWQPDFQQRQGGALLGFNVVEAEDMPAIAADSLAIAFGDFKAGYQIVDRQGIRILRDSFTAKPYVKFYTTKRVGGDVVNFEAIKLMEFAES